jgi:hypothetical protein
MSNTCETDYYNIFMQQLVQTLAQLSASLLSAAFVVPLYSYYVKGSRTPIPPPQQQTALFEQYDSTIVDSDESDDSDIEDNLKID